MQSALDQFRISIQRVRDLIAIHDSVKAQATAALDLSDDQISLRTKIPSWYSLAFDK